MADKQRSPFRDYLVYLVVRLVVCILQALPLRAGVAFSRFLAWVAYRVDRRHRQVALENLRHAFPDCTDPDRLVRDVYRHFTLVLVEIVHLQRRIHQTNWNDYVGYRSRREACTLVETLISGRPVLLATAHFGNWELSSHMMGLLGFPIQAIARPLDNPYLDRFLRAYREKHGQKMLAKKGEFDRIEEVLQGGGILGTLADQDAGQKGLFVDFFHRPASTHKALALLAVEHRVVIVVVAAVRVGGPLRYDICVEDVIRPEEYDDRPDALRAITERYTQALERLVRTRPEQYFWLHRRWKHQPKKRSKPAQAA